MYQMTWLGLEKEIDSKELFRLLVEWEKSDAIGIKKKIDGGQTYNTGIAKIRKKDHPSNTELMDFSKRLEKLRKEVRR